jgi:hypothetical protein
VGSEKKGVEKDAIYGPGSFFAFAGPVLIAPLEGEDRERVVNQI